MAETLTANYGWTKPDPGASANTWGSTLNATTDKIDNQVFQNQQAGVPVGSGAMWFGSVAPPNWILLQGQSLAVVGTYAALFAIFQYTYGGSGANFNLPDMRQKFPLGAGATNALGSSGGEATHLLTAAETASHTHTATQAAHGHAATQAAHTHTIATGGHSHTISTGAHAHSGVIVGLGGSGPIAGGVGGNLASGNTSTAGDLGGSTSFQGDLGGSTSSAAPAITVPTATPAITVAANTGGGTAHNNMPPFIGVNYMVRYQ